MAEVVGLTAFDAVDGPVEGFVETFAVEWFQEVIECVYLKGLERELIVSRDKDDGRHGRAFDLVNYVEAAHLGHLDIEEDEVGFLLLDGLHSSGAIVTFGEQFNVRFILEQRANALSSQWFIIDDQGPDFHRSRWACE